MRCGSSDLRPEQTAEAVPAETAAHAGSSLSPIEVVDYDDGWPALFEDIAQPIRKAMAELGAAVEHVGSTSVPGLPAKSVIDIDVVVRSDDDVAKAIALLATLGYMHEGDKGIRGREAFVWPAGARPHHLYVVVSGNGPHCDHIDFRNWLRQHPDVAEEYGTLKRGLAVQFRNDRSGYTEAKTAFVEGVLRAARTVGS